MYPITKNLILKKNLKINILNNNDGSLSQLSNSTTQL